MSLFITYMITRHLICGTGGRGSRIIVGANIFTLFAS